MKSPFQRENLATLLMMAAQQAERVISMDGTPAMPKFTLRIGLRPLKGVYVTKMVADHLRSRISGFQQVG